MNKFVITEATNFLRVFRLPLDYPEDYCFNGGHPVMIKLVDWFNAYAPNELWDKKKMEFDITSPEYQAHIELIKDFIKQKKYFNPESTFMVMTDYGDVFIVNPELRPNKLQSQMDELDAQMRKEANP